MRSRLATIAIQDEEGNRPGLYDVDAPLFMGLHLTYDPLESTSVRSSSRWPLHSGVIES